MSIMANFYNEYRSNFKIWEFWNVLIVTAFVVANSIIIFFSGLFMGIISVSTPLFFIYMFSKDSFNSKRLSEILFFKLKHSNLSWKIILFSILLLILLFSEVPMNLNLFSDVYILDDEYQKMRYLSVNGGILTAIIYSIFIFFIYDQRFDFLIYDKLFIVEGSKEKILRGFNVNHLKKELLKRAENSNFINSLTEDEIEKEKSIFYNKK